MYNYEHRPTGHAGTNMFVRPLYQSEGARVPCVQSARTCLVTRRPRVCTARPRDPRAHEGARA